MKITKHCLLKPINWSALPEISLRLKKNHLQLKNYTANLYWYPTSFEVYSIEETLNLIKSQGQPLGYELLLETDRNGESIIIRINQVTNIYNERLLTISISQVKDDLELNSLMDFLNLEPDISYNDSLPEIKRTAFIAYRFDEIGENLALRLTRFLELISFSVKTGRAFSPKKISDKVEERISDQSLLFVILTKGKDDTWLKQEPMIAKTQGKPIFILKDSEYEYNSGIFSDHEFIPFQLNNFEKSFIQILEGLRDLNLLYFK